MTFEVNILKIHIKVKNRANESVTTQKTISITMINEYYGPQMFLLVSIPPHIPIEYKERWNVEKGKAQIVA